MRREPASPGSPFEILLPEGEDVSIDDRLAMARRSQEINALGAHYVPRRRSEGEADAPAIIGDDDKEMDMAKAKVAKKAKGGKKAKAVKANGAEKKAAGTPRSESKTAKLLAAVENGATLKEICEASGFDERNARTTIGILRSRGGKKIELDRESGKYTLG